jgi:hypothetical protein
MHYPWCPVRPRRFQHIERAEDVGFDIGLGGNIRVRDTNQRGEVEDYLVVRDEPVHEARVADIAALGADRRGDVFRQVVEPARAVERVVMGESGYRGAGPGKQLYQRRADKTVTAGHQNLLAGVLLPQRVPPRAQRGQPFAASPRIVISLRSSLRGSRSISAI